MVILVLLGLGAGAVSALLLGTLVTGSLLALVLVWLAPMPVMIVGLGWHWLVGALAALTAASLVGLAYSGSSALSVFAMSGFPAMALAWFATVVGGGKGRARPGPLVYLVVSYVALAVLGLMLSFDSDYARLQTRFASITAQMLRSQLDLAPGAPLRVPGGPDLEGLPALYAAAAPVVSATMVCVSLLLTFWLSCIVVRRSGRLPFPWPEMARMRLPRSAGVSLAAGFALSAASAWFGLAGELLVAGLLLAFTLQGFAVAHFLLRANAARLPLLSGLWIVTLIFGFPALLIAIVGLLDHLLDFRRLGRADAV